MEYDNDYRNNWLGVVLGPIQAYFIILATSTKGRERLLKETFAEIRDLDFGGRIHRTVPYSHL